MSVLYIQAAYGAAAAGSCLLYGGALSYHAIYNRESKTDRTECKPIDLRFMPIALYRDAVFPMES